MFWFLACVTLAIFIYYALIKPFNYWKSMGVPQDPIWKIWLKLILSTKQCRSFADSIKKVYDEHPSKRYYGYYQLYFPTLVIRDPDLIKQITVKDFDHFMNHLSAVSNQEEPLWEKNLFFLQGEKWRKMRNNVTPSFTGSKMKIMFGLMNDCAIQFVKYFEEQGDNIIQVEMKDTFTRFANDVIATTAFGVTCDSMRNRDNEFYLMGKEATNFGVGFIKMLKIILILIVPNFCRIIGIRQFKKEVGIFFGNVIKANIKSRQETGVVRPDMIHLLLEARKGNSKEEVANEYITDEDIAAQAFVFFIAGFDSVATLMYFVAYELALHPDIQEKLQAEIDAIVNSTDSTLTYEKLSSMKYMDMIMSETLRKWPSAMRLDRVCSKPYTIQPVREGEKPVYLKEGALLHIYLYGIHRDAKYYPEPDRFNPERFSDENKSNINPYVNLPFGIGPRNCIGSRFALMEAKVVFFNLLAKFDIVVTEKTPIPLVLSKTKFQLDTDEGFWLGLKPRQM